MIIWIGFNIEGLRDPERIGIDLFENFVYSWKYGMNGIFLAQDNKIEMSSS